MPKITTWIVKSLMFLAISNNCFSQKKTFDIATYTPPKEWKKVTGNGVVSYTNINTATGTFCVLALYACSASGGDAQKDFKAEWKDLVVTPHQAETDPKTDIQTSPDGWKAVSAAAPLKIDSIEKFKDGCTHICSTSPFGKSVVEIWFVPFPIEFSVVQSLCPPPPGSGDPGSSSGNQLEEMNKKGLSKSFGRALPWDIKFLAKDGEQIIIDSSGEDGSLKIRVRKIKDD